MKLYVSGPISGMPGNNRDAFALAERRLQAAGFETVNPLTIDHSHYRHKCYGKRYGDEVHRYGCFLMADLRELTGCDGIVFLPGWDESAGCRAERSFAEALHIPVVAVDGVS